MGEKEKILSKLNNKDYRNDLELVLEDKDFDEEAKSLILSAFYKIDNFYKDYQSVKVNVENKNTFIENFINIIKKYCNKIEILSPKDFNGNQKYFINKEEGTIKCFPSENILLFAIFEMAEKSEKKENIDVLDWSIICLLNKGKTINSIEPIRDFNGWSWSVEINKSKNTEYNLIYQNLIMILGYDFVNKNINNPNIYKAIKKRVTERVSKIKAQKFSELLAEIALALYNNQSVHNHKECVESKEALEEKIEKLKNRREYINYTTKKNSVLIKRIEQIDIVLNDYELIKKEFSSSVLNNKNTYLCISDVVDKYETERENTIKEIEENNKIINPKEYLKMQEGYNKRLEIYNEVEPYKNKINITSKIIDFELLFLECEQIRFSKDENKKDINNFVYDLRYYNNIPFDTYKQVTLHKKISEKYIETIRDLINTVVIEKRIDIGVKDKNLYYNIFKYVLFTKIIELNNLIIKINYTSDNKINVQYYDDHLLEHEENIDIPTGTEITNKKTKKIKIL